MTKKIKEILLIYISLMFCLVLKNIYITAGEFKICIYIHFPCCVIIRDLISNSDSLQSLTHTK